MAGERRRSGQDPAKDGRKPAALTVASDFSSRSSHSLRMYGTDSLAAWRSAFWSSGDSVSHTRLENSSISGAIECSVTE